MTATESLAGPDTGSIIQVDPSPPPIQADFLSGRHEFTDDVSVPVRDKPDCCPTAVVSLRDASNLTALRITVQPDARFPWHTHFAPVLVAATQGEIVYVNADDCVRRHHPQTAFVDPGVGNHYMALTSSSTEVAVLIATVIGAPAAGPLTLPVEPSVGEAFDEKCGLAVAFAHGH